VCCSKGKGMSSSAIPYKRTPPSWCKATATEVRPGACITLWYNDVFSEAFSLSLGFLLQATAADSCNVSSNTGPAAGWLLYTPQLAALQRATLAVCCLLCSQRSN
jgi:hypothetical protein